MAKGGVLFAAMHPEEISSGSFCRYESIKALTNSEYVYKIKIGILDHFDEMR